MSYSQARWNAAHCLAHTTGGKIRQNATDERNFYRAVAEYGGYGLGARTAWSFRNPSTARRLGDRLVEKGLLVRVEEGRMYGYKLADEPQEYFNDMVVAFERQEAEERAAKQAAHDEAESKRMWAVMVADTRQVYGRIDGKVHQNIFTGPTGKADAEAYAAELRAEGNAVTMVFEITEIVNA